MDPQEAVEVVQHIRPRVVIPLPEHDFSRSLAGLILTTTGTAEAFKALVEKSSLGTEVVLLKPGSHWSPGEGLQEGKGTDARVGGTEMQTIYGELRVIDAHIHFFSHRFFQSFLRSRGHYLPERDSQSLLQRLGVPILFHFGLLQSTIGATLKLPSQADARFSNPMDVQKAARDFPGVNFIVPHFGAGYFRETLLLAAHCPNVYLDTSSANGWLRYMPYPMDLKLVFQRTLDAVGPERLIFGTDSSWFRGFRRGILEEQLSILEAIGVTGEEAQRIMGGNMARLLRLAW